MTNPLIIAAIAIITFLVIWILVCLIISRFGWRDLAERYQNDSPPQGARYSGQSARIGRFGSYNGCLNFHIDKKGIYLAVISIFRAGHPPLFIPWSAIRLLKQKRGILGQSFIYDLGVPRVCRAAFRGDIHRAIQHAQSGS